MTASDIAPSKPAVSVFAALALIAASVLTFFQSAQASPPTCNGMPATVYVEGGTVIGGSGSGSVFSGTLNGTNGADVIVGTPGDDVINAGNGSDTVCSLAGDDDVFLGAGDNYADLGPGDDYAEAANGNDTIVAGDGNDTVVAGGGNNNVDGGNGNDAITTANGNDVIAGAAGLDSCSDGPGTDTVTTCESATGGVVTVRKDAQPDAAKDFAFTGGLGSFSLDDDADGTLQSSTGSLRAAGSYAVTEGTASGWTLSSIVCNDSGSTVNLGTRTATIDLDAGESVTCTFVNVQNVASSAPSSGGASVAASSAAVIVSSAASSACIDPAAADLVGHWKLDEQSGTTAIDSAGGDNNGTHENGPTYVSGTTLISPNPSAVAYDGVNDQTRVANSTGGAFNFGTSDFTVSAYMRSTTGDRSVLGNFSAATRGWGLYVYANGSLNFFGYGDQGINDAAQGSGVLDGQWHHVAGTYSRSGSQLTIRTYLDGALAGTNTATVGNIASNSDLLFGRYLLQPHYAGSLDDIRVYDRALTANEVGQAAAGCQGGSAGSQGSSISASGGSSVTSSVTSSVASSALSSAASSVLSSAVSSVASSASSAAAVSLICDGQTATIYVKPNGRIYGGTQSGQTFYGSLQGGAGNDVIVGTAGGDSIKGGGGDDVICGRAGGDQIWGDAGSDRIFGGAGADQIDAGTGQDTVSGGSENDSVSGGDGSDVLCGRAGDDSLRGENDADFLEGDAGNNLLSGGAGNDVCANGFMSSCTAGTVSQCVGLSDNN